MKTYLVTNIWSGALNIGNMRVFNNFVDAKKHWHDVEATESARRMYEVSSNEAPKLLKNKDVAARSK